MSCLPGRSALGARRVRAHGQCGAFDALAAVSCVEVEVRGGGGGAPMPIGVCGAAIVPGQGRSGASETSQLKRAGERLFRLQQPTETFLFVLLASVLPLGHAPSLAPYLVRNNRMS